MIAGNVSGEMVPPMVVYKALNIYSSWYERGPKGALYSCSKSGWFDSYQFEKWFFELLLPILKRKVGKKMLIGDSLSSHISASVVEACRQHNIQFVSAPQQHRQASTTGCGGFWPTQVLVENSPPGLQGQKSYPDWLAKN